MQIIKRQDPPATTAGRKRDAERALVVAELKKRPGEWALVPEGVAAHRITPWKKHGCEAVSRRSAKDPKKSDVYARWPISSHRAAQADADRQRAAERKPQHRSAADTASKAATPAKATLPLTTSPRLDPNDPDDAALLRERQRFEAGRAARLNKGRTV